MWKKKSFVLCLQDEIYASNSQYEGSTKPENMQKYQDLSTKKDMMYQYSLVVPSPLLVSQDLGGFTKKFEVTYSRSHRGSSRLGGWK